MTSNLEVFGQSPADLVENQADERLGAADVRRRHHEVERCRPFALDEVTDPPIAARRHLGNDRIAIEPEEAHGG